MKQLIRKLPGIAGAMRAIGYSGGHTRGVYPTFAAALRAIPRHRKIGYDHPEASRIYIDIIDVLRPSDYASLFWIRPLLPDLTSVFDFGGNLGRSYFPFRKYLPLPDTLRWIVCDVAAVIAAGRELTLQRNAAHLSFTTEWTDASGCDLIHTSGTLQYVEPSLEELLKGLPERPRHLLINRVPFSDKPTYYTIQDFGPACCPYRISNRREFCSSMTEVGYELVDSWVCAESRTGVRFRPSYEVQTYSGFYFRRSTPNTLDTRIDR
jgi:putative methyltransferase (TIGR04325 family)